MASDLIWAVQIYLGLGAVAALGFLGIGIDRIDENARGAWVFRPFLIPGILLIWPLVLFRWWQLERAGTEDTEGQARFRPPLLWQPRLALLLAVAVPVMILGAMVLRQDGPNEAPAQLIEPAQ